ncbi:MAG: winged helix-turn-helix domain-containing protein [Pseudomonadota bacterium]
MASAAAPVAQGFPENASAPFMLARILVDPPAHELTVAGEPRRVEPRAMKLLVYLAQRPQQVVSKAQILSDVWEGREVVPEALQRVVSLLRKALEDPSSDTRLIETISKQGYRLLVSPTPVHEASLETSETRRPWLWIVAALLLVVLLFGISRFVFNESALAPVAVPGDGPQSDAPAPRADPSG